ncbi:MAG TPA: hypothetical protein V6D20_24460, partial [Candidatus Obscuribacterales bacterium]
MVLILLGGIDAFSQKHPGRDESLSLTYSNSYRTLESLNSPQNQLPDGALFAMPIFPEETCLEGSYHVGFRLQLDAEARTPDLTWTFEMQAALFAIAPNGSEQELTPNERIDLRIGAESGTVLSSWTFDATPEGISCSDETQYEWRVYSMGEPAASISGYISLDFLYYRVDRLPLSMESNYRLAHSYTAEGKSLLSWDYISGAQSYDLEWVFIDRHDREAFDAFAAESSE